VRQQEYAGCSRHLGCLEQERATKKEQHAASGNTEKCSTHAIPLNVPRRDMKKLKFVFSSTYHLYAHIRRVANTNGYEQIQTFVRLS
jgi:hypothetical protein